MENLQSFLSENRSNVIEFYNESVAPYYKVSLKDFMTDLFANFRKITTSKELKKFDLVGNLEEAKSRLGLMSQTNFEYAEDKKTSVLRKKHNGTSYMSLV